VIALASAIGTGLLARAAPHLRWTDAPRGADESRKLQRRAVPCVGGAAILVALLLAPEVLWERGSAAPFPWPGPPWAALALACVFVVGTADDVLSFRAAPKAALQLLALAPLGFGAWRAEAGLAASLGLMAAGFLALNALNTFDNSDGAAAALAAAGFLLVPSLAAAACLGFLPLNVDSSRARNRTSGAPSAYLGDAGAFLLAFLALADARALGILWLPLLDLARLAVVRVRAGSRPWIGDRRHLAHRLLARGLAPLAVAGIQVAIALPACALVPRAVETGQASWGILGLLATSVLFALALWRSDASAGAAAQQERSVPCPRETPSE